MTGIIAVLGGGAGAGTFTAVATPSPVTGSGAGTQTSGISTCTPSGGTAPYTYAWAFVSGDAIGIQTQTTASTRFTGSVPSAEVFVASFQCVVTDATLATAPSNIVSARLTGL